MTSNLVAMLRDPPDAEMAHTLCEQAAAEIERLMRERDEHGKLMRALTNAVRSVNIERREWYAHIAQPLQDVYQALGAPPELALTPEEIAALAGSAAPAQPKWEPTRSMWESMRAALAREIDATRDPATKHRLEALHTNSTLARMPAQPEGAAEYRKWPGEPPHCMSCDCGMTDEQKAEAAKTVPLSDYRDVRDALIEIRHLEAPLVVDRVRSIADRGLNHQHHETPERQCEHGIPIDGPSACPGCCGLLGNGLAEQIADARRRMACWPADVRIAMGLPVHISEKATALREWIFDRYRNGKLKAQGVKVHAATEAEAWEQARSLLNIDGNVPTDELRLHENGL